MNCMLWLVCFYLSIEAIVRWRLLIITQNSVSNVSLYGKESSSEEWSSIGFEITCQVLGTGYFRFTSRCHFKTLNLRNSQLSKYILQAINLFLHSQKSEIILDCKMKYFSTNVLVVLGSYLPFIVGNGFNLVDVWKLF